MNVRRRKFLFVLSLCLVSCGSGMVAAHCRVFPYTLANDAVAAAGAYLEVYAPKPRRTNVPYTAPTVRSRADAVADDGQLFLLAGGIDFLPDDSATGHTLAWIMDRFGRVQHVWEYDPSIWGRLEKVTTAPLKSEVYPVGLHLFDNGDLLVNFQGENTWPYGVGLALFDKHSRLIWRQELINHHWFSVGDDGRIYTASMRIIDSPVRLGDARTKVVAADGHVTEDLLLILDRDGNLLEEVSMLDALVDSGLIGLFPGATDENIDAFTGDPTHLNDVRVVTSRLAAGHPLLDPGDVLVSFRSLNAIGILDGQTWRFKWISAGTAVRQHSPRIVGDGILLLDNRGGPWRTGGSQLVRIDLETRLPSRVFPRDSRRQFATPFYTEVAGHLDVQAPGRVLVTLTDRGEVWEVDLATGSILWEYVHVHADIERWARLYTAKYVRAANFDFNRTNGDHR